MLHVETLPFFADNYGYLVVCKRSGYAAAIDPADADAVFAAARRLGVELRAVWCTHHHWDHVGGTERLNERGVEVCGHLVDRERIPGLSRAFRSGECFSLGQLQVQALHTPGHTRGSVVYLVEDAAFTGDTLFAAGCGRCFEGSPETLYRSLCQRLLPRLAPETRIFCGHNYARKNLAFAQRVEPDNEEIARRIDQVDEQQRLRLPTVPYLLSDDLATNPFLRSDQPGVRRYLTEQDPEATWDDPVRAFVRLRALRNRF